MSLGAVVICFNEQDNIERCLKSLQFCDEIIVVDAESTDNTREIAGNFTEKIFVRPWKGYISQKNEAVSLCSCEWILSLDGDEEVTPELKKEVLETLETQPPFSAYALPRKNLHSGKWIKHGGWYPNYLVRLFQKDKGRWKGTELHERWETTGNVGQLKNDLIHYSFKSFSDQVARNNRYSSLGAEALKQQGVQFSLWKMIGKTFSKFIETYLLKLGLLDGYPGFIIAVSAAYSVFLKWAKLWELENNEK